VCIDVSFSVLLLLIYCSWKKDDMSGVVGKGEKVEKPPLPGPLLRPKFGFHMEEREVDDLSKIGGAMYSGGSGECKSLVPRLWKGGRLRTASPTLEGMVVQWLSHFWEEKIF